MTLLIFVTLAFIFASFISHTKKRTNTGNNYVRKPKPSKRKVVAKRRANPLGRNLWDTYDTVLEAKFPYYQSLGIREKNIFQDRLDRFIRTHKFVPAEMDEVTLEMKIMISACAIQLTFGLNNFLANHIQGFKVYPDVYYSRMLDNHLRGHYLPNGIIFLSYKHFEPGYADAEDGRNLGLHEMAHALHHTYAGQVDYRLFFNDLVKDWFVVAKKGEHIERPDAVDGFLRKYAATNIHEFFAVSVENFFERPQELNARLPMVYKHLCFLLNQNPLGIRLTAQSTPRPKNLERPIFKEQASVYGALFSMLFGAFLVVGPFALDWGATATFTVFGSVFFFSGLIIRLTTNEVKFYDTFIRIESIVGKRIVKTIDNHSLLYIAYNKTFVSHKPSERLSFVLYDNELKHTADVIAPTEKFRRQVQVYCKERGITFIQ